ncbi:hypothetical protein [Kitasatospora sp. NPDC050543]|uniref:hypothetical protein n=1 Tax=Kitasatospora sp. NPDC050543 TaxID=3364054 RepID=UPI0037B81219
MKVGEPGRGIGIPVWTGSQVVIRPAAFRAQWLSSPGWGRVVHSVQGRGETSVSGILGAGAVFEAGWATELGRSFGAGGGPAGFGADAALLLADPAAPGSGECDAAAEAADGLAVGEGASDS